MNRISLSSYRGAWRQARAEGILVLLCMVGWLGGMFGRSDASESGMPAVRIFEESLTLPTYPWQEDVNPKFWALEGGPRLSTTVQGSIVYPYVMQDHLLRTREMRTYRAIGLENEYLRVICIPELGGRIHSVLDKTTGEEMFHLNRVIKPAMIAMRGAWISGGIEWNTGPHGHTVTCLSPVNVTSVKNPDGSASLEISNTEQIFRTRWIVRLTLHPGRAFLDERISLYNPTDGMHPYYFWNCTAFPNRTGTRFIFPMSLGTDHHAREFFRWPIHEGKDLSWLKNYDTYASVFAVECTHDFFGAYDVDADRGLVQWADHRQLSGKKAWTWGEWDFGRVAEEDLTDEDGPYIEVQSGPLMTQSDYGRLRPRQVVAWREWWYPVHGLGDGFEFATRDVALNVVRKRTRVELRLIGTGNFPKTECLIRRGEEVVARARVDITPAEPASVQVPLGAQEAFSVELRTPDGQVLASYKSPLDIPKVDPPDPSRFQEKPDAEKSADDFYGKGEKTDLATDRRAARELYRKALERDPNYVPALRGLAILDFEAGLYETALGSLKHALEVSPDDPWSLFYAAACHYRLKRPDEATELATKAATHDETAPVSFDLLGRIAMQRGRFAEATTAFQQALKTKPGDPVAQDHLILALFADNRIAEAKKLAALRANAEATAVVPQWVLAAGDGQAETDFLRKMVMVLGDFEFEIHEAAHFMEEVGLHGLAYKLMRAVAADAQAAEKLSAMSYWLSARFADRLDRRDETAQWLKQAERTRVPKRFASRLEELDLLDYVTRANPADGHAWLQRGCLLTALGRVEEGVSCWKKAVELDPTDSVAWRNLGLAAAAQGDLASAENCYRKAIQANPNDQTLYRDLGEILIAAQRRSEAIELLERMPVSGVRRTDLTVLLAQAYLDEKRYDDCLRVLENTPYFTNWEGQDIVWRLFNRAHVLRGQQRMEKGDNRSALADFEAALTYPKNLHVGRSNKPIEAPAQYWRGVALARLGRLEEAQEAWLVGANLPSVPGEQDEYRQKCRQALNELPKEVGTNRIFIHGPVYRCFKIDRDLVLTGEIDDPLWQAAPVVRLNNAVNGTPGRYATEVRMLYNNRYLYVAFRCEDDFVWSTLTERDSPIYDEECVEIFLCPTGNPRLYYEINVSPLNTVFDAFILNGRPIGGERIRFTGLKDYTCEGLITKVFVTGKIGERGARGWSAEYAIPFRSLAGSRSEVPESGEQWFINLFRIDATSPTEREYDSWVPVGAVDFHRPWCFGILKFD